jgi:hypothetical protein
VRARLPHPALLIAVLAAIAVSSGSAAASAPSATGVLGVDQAFVIGNGNATVGAPVTFWGSQWWMDNSLKVADAPDDLTAPASFKGFAASLDATQPLCGPFTTSTGNSPHPPAAPLPSTMYVLVANSVVQSGSTISGKVVGYALVSTDPGYDGDPGHAGTGTVVAVYDCSNSF